MLIQISYFLPCLVSFFWAVIFLMRRKEKRNKNVIILLLLSAVYFFIYAFYVSPSVSYEAMSIMDALAQPIALSLWVLNIALVHQLSLGVALKRNSLIILFFPVLVQMTATFIIYALIGFDDAALFYQSWDTAHAQGAKIPEVWNIVPSQYNNYLFHLLIFICRINFNILLAIYFLLLLFFSVVSLKKRSYKFGDFSLYFFKNKVTDWPSLIFVLEILLTMFLSPIVVYGRTFLYLRPILTFILSVCLTVVQFMLSFVTYHMHSLTNMAVSQTKGDNFVAKTDNISLSMNPDNLLPRLIKALEKDKAFTDSMLSLEGLAQMLHTNRTTLSNLINRHYSKSYKNLIAEMRIKESQKYMLENPLATLEDVAAHSGFNTPATFYHRFKEMAGLSPRAWLLSQKTRN